MLTGMRVGELAALKWSCIDEDFIHIDFSEHRLDYSDRPSELIIGEPKNGKHRVIPITKEIRELLDIIQSIHHASPTSDDFIFVRSNGSRYSGHCIGSALARRADEAGISKTSIHGIRRTVSSMLRIILPAKAVAEMLGHLETTNERFYNYDICEISEKRKALSEMSSKVITIRSGVA